MQKLISRLDLFGKLRVNILKIGVCFLLFFIPLWPKLPLIDIPNTWVYIRLEDIFLAILVLIWFIKLWQRKVSLATPLTLPIFIYWLIGGVSLAFSLIFLARSIPNFFPHLAILHWLRRIEYMIIFFVAFSTIKSIKDIYHYLIVLAITVMGVILYGFGQKIFGFPAFLTMNEEFAKGIPLYLPPTARITSTFAGHYDLAAYLVFVIAILGSCVFGVKKILGKVTLLILAFSSFILLLLTASRVSFVVYLIIISLVLWWQKKKILIIPTIILSIILLNFVSGAGERFFKTFRVKQVVYDVRTGRPIATIKEIEGGRIITEEEKTPAEEALPIGSGFIGSFLIQKALVYDISFTTRFQGEWPRAMVAFKRNPILGSGYSSVSLATDNDYLRILGETGIVGLLSFLFLITSLAIFIKLALSKVASPLVRSLAIGVAAGLSGLAINAILIDVFEASKVAFSLWLILGITLGGLALEYRQKIPLFAEIKKLLLHPLVPVVFLFILTFVLFGKSLAFYFVGDDFTWLRWAAQGTLSDIPSYFSQAFGFFYRPLQKILYLASFTVFWLMPGGYHFLSLLLHFLVASVLYLFVLKITKERFFSILVGLIFLVFSSHGESIFWISTLGHILSTLFIIFGLYCFTIFRIEDRKPFYSKKSFAYLLSFIFLSFSLLSYEGAIVGPLLLLWFEATLGKKKFLAHLPFLALIPVYILLRNWAGAHGLSGDYSYNWQLLPANFFGNLFGYLGLIFVGPKFTSIYDALRISGQANKELFLLLASGLILAGAVVLKRGLTWWEVRPGTRSDLIGIFALGFIPISLLPFLGLGNITERYAYLASAGAATLLALVLLKIYLQISKRSSVLAVISLILLTLTIVGFYLADLLDLRKTYFTFTLDRTFYFVDVPIREGRAWVFPVGLPDALWHTFRDESLKVVQVKRLEEALDLKDKTSNSHVFVFENGEIKEVIRETKQVPIK
ncbi:O-antigen ligase family protein [Candidatus Gottesmanbacteria bacterium]|nr:O-antigen ligase family protein [Candidatus Gottesmanbacteria bacterium]